MRPSRFLLFVGVALLLVISAIDGGTVKDLVNQKVDSGDSYSYSWSSGDGRPGKPGSREARRGKGSGGGGSRCGGLGCGI